MNIQQCAHEREVQAALNSGPMPLFAVGFATADVFIDYKRSGDFGYVQRVNHAVAERLFPNRTSTSMFLKLYGEIGEMVADPDSGEEVADALIMLLDHCTCLGIDAGAVILAKLEKNLKRTWKIDIRTGVAQHEDIPSRPAV